MTEITDETIKQKHNEFDVRIKGILLELRSKPNASAMVKLRQALSTGLKGKR